jgi:tetratricopeptide (TPR) repeat protein
VNSFFFPGGKSSKPILSYKLPDFYRRQQRYPEALESLHRILRHYPKEARAWIGVIEVQMIDLHDPEAARQTYQRALHKLRKDRIALEDVRDCWNHLLTAPSENRNHHAFHVE